MSERIELLNGLGWAELGCWIDGHWGQYGPDRLVQIAAQQGWMLSDPADVIAANFAIDRADRLHNADVPSGHDEADLYEIIVELSNEAEQYLNDQCPDGYSFGWHDGEFYLWDDDDWKDAQ